MSNNENKLKVTPTGEVNAVNLYVSGAICVGVQQVTPVTGNTVTATKGALLLTPGATLATLTVKFPDVIANGQKFTVISTTDVTTLTITNATFQAAAPSTLAANFSLFFTFFGGKWYEM